MGGTYTQFGSLEFIRRIRNFCLMAGGNLSVEAANVRPTEESNYKIHQYLTEDLQINIEPENCLTLELDVIDNQKHDILDEILDDYKDVALMGPESPDLELTLPEEMEIDNVATDLADAFNLNDWIGDKVVLDGVSREKLVDDCKFMEKEFRDYHSSSDNGLLRNKNVTCGLVQKLSDLPRLSEYDPKMIKRFVVSRTLKRMKYIHTSTIQHAKSARAKKKVIDHVHSKPASKVTLKAASKLKAKAVKKKAVKRLKK